MTENIEQPGGRRWSRWRVAAWGVAALILLLPLIAMQFTDEVNWSVADFACAGALLIATSLTFEFVVRRTRDHTYRAAVFVALTAALFLVWVSGAVGIIGSEDDAANLMYGGVLAIGFLGAMIARFRPQGMARVMFTMAIAQASVAVIALAAGLGSTGPTWPRDILGLTGFFVTMFVASGLLFRNAALRQAPAG